MLKRKKFFEDEVIRNSIVLDALLSILYKRKIVNQEEIQSEILDRNSDEKES